MRQALLFITILSSTILISCSELLSTADQVQNGDFYPGQEIRYMNPGGGSVVSHLLDTDGDGVVDGMDVNEDGESDIFLEKIQSGLYSIDVENDGIIDAYLFVNDAGLPVVSITRDGIGVLRIVILGSQFAGFSQDLDDDPEIEAPDFDPVPDVDDPSVTMYFSSGSLDITLSWEAVQDNSAPEELRYALYYNAGSVRGSPQAIFSSTTLISDTISGTQTSFNFTLPDYDTTYRFYLIVYDTADNYRFYNVASINIPNPE